MLTPSTNTQTDAAPPCLTAALDFAARGWPVIPLHWAVTFGPKSGPDRARCSCGRDECASQGKHPIGDLAPRWRDDATTDAAVIRCWFGRRPRANIGLVTGVAFDVIDFDGEDALDALDAGAPPEAGVIDGPMVFTGREGGMHLYVAPTGAGNHAPITGMPGVDYRGRGGYVVAPPSTHYSGVAYSWAPAAGPHRPLPEVGWLRQLLCPPRPATDRLVLAPPNRSGETAVPPNRPYGEAALAREVARLLATPEGGRNPQLNASAWTLARLVAGGHLEAKRVISELYQAGVGSGLTDGETRETIISAMRKGLLEPRHPKGTA